MPKVSAASVDYMELAGAVKDRDCSKVEVKGGVSSALGCCNAFEFQKGMPKQFRCGTCAYVSRPEKPNSFYGA